MKRVAVTGLGAVTPIGNDVRTTWEAAVAGRSGIDWIRSFDADGLPVRVAAEVKDFDPTHVASPKEVRKLERNVLLALGAAREAMGDADLNGFDPRRVGVVFGTAIGGVNGILEQEQILRERGPDRVSPNFLPERPRRLCERPAARSRSGSRASTTPSSRPARPARTRSARPRRSSSAATRTPFWPAAARRACIR